MGTNAIIKCTNLRDENIYTVVIKYRVYRNDRGKLFGRLLVLKHKVENFLKEFVDDEILFQNPILQRTKDELLDLFQGLTSLCSGISSAQEMPTIPDLPLSEMMDASHEMKFVKGTSLSDLWLCYVENSEFLKLLKRLQEKYDNNELEPFILYPQLGEHVYFKQGANIFRGIVQEYVMPEDCDDEERVDVKVFNIDNSDVIVLPQSCFYHLDKDGTELPAQCVLCTADEHPEQPVTQNDATSSNNLSLASLKKHKLDVSFRHKKVAVAGTSQNAQCVYISVCADKFKDKNNGFNVNSKEFVPRSKPNDVQTASANSPDNDCKSGQTTRSSSPVGGSSQEDAQKNEPAVEDTVASLSIRNNQAETVHSDARSVEEKKSSLSSSEEAKLAAVIVDATKENVENKVNVMNRANKNPGKSIVTNANANITTTTTTTTTTGIIRAYDKNRNNALNKEYSRYNAAKIADNKTNKLVPLITEKSKNAVGISSPSNEIRTKSGPPSTCSQPSQLPAALPPNPQMSPYLFQSVPQFPPGPIHFPGGQYVPIPTPQQLNSTMPFHFPQYPYATAPAYLPSAPPPPPTAHSQYHMPPVSSSPSPYQPYMQPVAMAPFFSSQPPFSQQFYQPPHLQPTWSHLQPSFHVSGAPQQSAGGAGGGVGSAGNVGIGKTDLGSSTMSKYK